MTKTLVATLVGAAMLTTPALAAKPTGTTTDIAPEAMATEAPAPANYDANLKALNEKTNSIGIEVANPIIVIDPGHGGTDSGAVGNGLYEKNLTLDIANRTTAYIRANYPATVYQTRTSDVTMSLDARTSFANSKGANFFVSQHINSYSTSTPNGLETYYYPGSTSGSSLATNIYNKLKASYTTLRGVKTAEFYVLKYTNMPASLGETGFISNPTDASKLGTTTFRQQLATQYAQGMHVYWWGY
ncbi:N-acetylmuramoyl-L-alanine amidase [Tumebacillus sp. DT12]|uniref:N-acetylmuramoyl-L-alanine amidase n=1 Tax=Tumebacillus lacus TaxID=2995335 RepID=A0ABT3X2G9_9BACL|nr:N-acetylmuramoyl-L-alanine amidase [Tumebacillus lacus]MCX7571100.1 N-acetylmuramoyl-L-alanine amidase [Tumebacillus lacus]